MRKVIWLSEGKLEYAEYPIKLLLKLKVVSGGGNVIFKTDAENSDIT